MSEQEIQRLAREIRETRQSKQELEQNIQTKENAVRELGDQNKQKVEEFKEEIKYFNREKERLENILTERQKEIRLRGIIKSKEKRIKMLEQRIKECKANMVALVYQSMQEAEEREKEIEDLKKKRDEYEKEKTELEEEIKELKRAIEKMEVQVDQLESKIQENEKRYDEGMANLRENYQKDIDKIKDRNLKKIQAMENKMEEMEEIRKACDWNEEKVQTLTEANRSLKKDLKESQKLVRIHEKNYHMLYIAQICSDLQTNVYHYVMPKNYCPEGCCRAHKVKKIEEDMDDEEIDDEQREGTKKRLEKLKEKGYWKKIKYLKKAIGLLQEERNHVAHPQDLDERGAKHAAMELQKQNKLTGKGLTFDNVTQIIEIWSASKSLLNDENYNMIQ